MELVERKEPPVEWKLAQPIVWATLKCGVRIEELLPDKYEEVAELIKTEVIPRDTMCKALNMAATDPESCETFLQEAVLCMKDGFSVVGVVDEEEKNEEGEVIETRKRVVAAMIASVVQQREAMETFNRIKIYKGEAYNKYAKLNNHMMRKGDLYTNFDTDSYLRIFHIVVNEEYRNKGISMFMGKLATKRLTQLFKQKICVKLCPDRATQHLMRRLGFLDYLRLGYEEWIENGKQVFYHTGVGNYSIVLMTYEVSESTEFEEVDEPLEEIDEEPEAGPPTTFPGRARTGQPSVGNRGHLIKPTAPVVTGRLVDYRYLFLRGFDPESRR